jgi:hypothetical protein
MFKELPPPFNSVELGAKYDKIVGLAFSTNKSIEFSIPKGQYSRRLLQLPHPANFIQITNHLTDIANWIILENHFKTSTYSHSKVIENKESGSFILNKDNRAVKTNYESFSNSKEKTIVDSFDMLYELKIDITKFYPSIYTHSIVWAILGKERAKELWKLKSLKTAESDFPLYDFADKLDNYIRYCQDNQSVGIPIGPDTSHIIAEIVGCYIDKQLKGKFPDVKAFRYFDDYHIYIDTEEKAQKALKFIQQILADLQLSINESKLKIQRFPFAFQESWVKEINDVSFKKSSTSNIKQYFNILFDLANKYPDNTNTIFSYGLRTFEKRTTEIDDKNWRVFESLLLKTLLIEPSTLEMASRIFETYSAFLTKAKIKIVLLKILENHCELNHHFETVWVLWILKQLQIILPVELSDKIINTSDNFSILLLLDLDKSALISDGGLTVKSKQNIVDILDLAQTTDWLLYYEAVEVKKWLTATKRPEFEPFRKAGISFYDGLAKTKIFDKPKAVWRKPRTTGSMVDTNMKT